MGEKAWPIGLLLLVACAGGSDKGDGDTDDGDVQEEPGEVAAPDEDGDGHGNDVDCNDTEASINPGAEEVWYDGIDQNCDGASDYDQDADGQDASEHGGDDCVDTDASAYLGAEEIWYNGVDNDCDGIRSDYDQDWDGLEAAEYGGTDCDDTDNTVYPGAEEVWYDGVDGNCDELSDYDQDLDGFDIESSGGEDCDDTDPDVKPGVEDAWYDGIDTNCDGASDYDADGDGYDSSAYGGEDCRDLDALVSPAAEEVCDRIDNDCDGTRDGETAIDGPCPEVKSIIIEDFEAGTWPADDWSTVGSGGSVTGSAFEGEYCALDPGWSYNLTEPVEEGATLSAWVYAPGTAGRVYLGFDSSAGGTRSFVFAPNSGDIRFQQNDGYSYEELTIESITVPTGEWVEMRVALTSPTAATGVLLDESGRELASVKHDYSSAHGGGGVAIRTFGGVRVDYVTLEP